MLEGVTTSEREFTIGNGESRTGCETGVDCLFKFSGRILGWLTVAGMMTRLVLNFDKQFALYVLI